MSFPSPWHTIGRHGLLPAATHDEMARFDIVALLNAQIAQSLSPKVKAAYESRARQSFRLRHGRNPVDRSEVAEAVMRQEPAYRVFSLVRRNAMEIRQHAGRQLVAREAESLRVRAKSANEGVDTLKLDPTLEPPRCVSAVDTHLMQGGYTAERMTDDVKNPANYDAGMNATTGGAAGP